jgi:hypothetical protein
VNDAGSPSGLLFHALAQGLDRGLPLWHHMGVDESPHAMNVVTRAQAQAQGLTRYFTGKPCKNGHLAEKYTSNRLCLGCLADRQAESEARRKADGRWEAWMKRRDEKVKQRRKSDPDFVAARTRDCKKWRKANMDRVQRWSQEVRCQDPQYIIKNRLMARVNAVIGGHRSGTLAELTGDDGTQLVKHIESLFVDGMSWENRSEWHIDHIRPCASFDLTDPAQQRECFHYTNLQPLWAEDNLRKSDKWEELAA